MRIFIPSHRRAGKVETIKILSRMGLKSKVTLVVHEKEYSYYADYYPDVEIIPIREVGISATRKRIFEIVTEEGITKHIQMDDDISYLLGFDIQKISKLLDIYWAVSGTNTFQNIWWKYPWCKNSFKSCLSQVMAFRLEFAEFMKDRLNTEIMLEDLQITILAIRHKIPFVVRNDIEYRENLELDSIVKKDRFEEAKSIVNKKYLIKLDSGYGFGVRYGDILNDFIMPTLSRSYIMVEPHPDDAVLSSGELLLLYQPNALITVFTGKNRDRGSEKLASDLDIDYINLEFPDIDLSEPKVEFPLKDLKQALCKVTKKYKIFNGKFIVSVLGSYHPAHILLSRLLPSRWTIFARDFPHSYKKTAKMPKNIKRIKTIDGLFDEKIKLFKRYYKTQHGLLFYNRQYFELKPPEEYYIKLPKWWW